MNILVLTNVYPYEKDDNTDITKVVAYFARKWVQLGHNVMVVVNSTAFPHLYYVAGKYVKGVILKRNDRIAELPSELWTKKFDYIDEGIPVINLPIKKMKPHGAFGDDALKKQQERIVAELEERGFKPDVITGHWLNPQLMLVAGLAQYFGAKCGFIFHSDYMRDRYDQFEVQKYLDQVDNIGFRSRAAMDVAKEYMRFKNPPFVCSSGIPDDYVEKYAVSGRPAIRDRDYKVICVGRLVGYKNIDVTISAVSTAFEGTDYSFDIVGVGPLEEQFKTQIKSGKLEQHVHLSGRMPREQLQEKMRDSDIFVLISSNEVFGMVYVEAMLQGCIVVAAKFSGVDGIIVDGENGFLCEAGNEEELKTVLKKIDSLSSEEKKRVSDAAVQTAMKQTETNTAEYYLKNISRS